MKKLFYPFVLLAMAACTSEVYDDADVQKRLGDLETRMETVEKTCTALNSNVVNVSQAMENIDKKFTVASISQVENGYVIKFTNNETVVISNGDKGAKGDPGEKGDTGSMPEVGVSKDGDIYYWTVNGELLKDASGNKVSASAGAAVAPKFKVEDNTWFVSVDGGTSWEKVEGAKVGADITVTEDEFNVYLTLSDKSVITLPKTSAFAVKVAQTADVSVALGEVAELSYTVSNADAGTRVFVEGNGVEAVVVPADEKGGVIRVTVPSALIPDAYIIVKAIKTSTSEYSAQVVTFVEQENSILTVATTAYEVPALGGTVEVNLSTNTEYSVEIPADASWLTKVAVKAIREETVIFSAALNEGAARTAAVKFTAAGIDPVVVTIVQAEGKPVETVGPNLADDQCAAVPANTVITWNPIGNNKTWYPLAAENDFASFASLTWIYKNTVTGATKNQNVAGLGKYYTMGVKYSTPDDLPGMVDGDGPVITIAVKELKAGRKVTIMIPFNMSGTGSRYYNLEYSLDGTNWELATVNSVAWLDGVWNSETSETGLAYTSVLNSMSSNIRLGLKGVPHMIKGCFVADKNVVNSAIKIRISTVDCLDELNWETGEIEGIPTTSYPSAYFDKWVDYTNPGVAVYNGPAIMFE